jgi:hypothetical protein
MQEHVELLVGENVLRGMLHWPAANAAKLAEKAGGIPLLLIFHGFTGTKVENHFIYPKLCRSLERAGVASLRFDFSGSGESDGEFRNMTLSGELEEARNIWDFALGLHGIDQGSVFILGHSMGGLVAGMLAAEKEPKGLILLAPAGNMADIAYETLLRRTIAEDPRGGSDIGGLILGRGFLPDLNGMDPLALSKKYLGAVLIIHGTADPVVPEVVSKQWFSSFSGAARYIALKGAGHNYDSIAYEERIFTEVENFIIS